MVVTFLIRMQVTDYIQNKIDRLPRGDAFTYGCFIAEVSQMEATIKTLSRKAVKLLRRLFCQTFCLDGVYNEIVCKLKLV